MSDIQSTIDKICILLEEAIEERDWKPVSKALEKLNDLYTELDNSSDDFLDY